MLVVENADVRLELAPDWGARVVSLVDKRSGRDWLVKGPCAGDAGEGAVYAFDQARGWDECFPTVAPCSGAAYGWPRDLRDHGDLWGRPWTCQSADNGVTSTYTGDRFEFSRQISLDGDVIFGRYQVENTGTAPFGYLYSQHMLLNLRPGETISCAGVSAFHRSGGNTDIAWPDPDLHPVRDQDAGIAAKLYAPVTSQVSVTAGGYAGSLRLQWEPSDAQALGLWLDYGGWPDGAPMHQVAIEPTTAAADSLAEADPVWLAPGETQAWQVTITLQADGATIGDARP